MRCEVWTPVGEPGTKFPGLIFFSEIFQLTTPVRRTCQLLAGHGFVVLAPEVYHEQFPAGTVLSYSPEDSARGNAAKTARPLAAYDGDAAAAVAGLRAMPVCSGVVGAAGVCLGGGLAFRAAVTQPTIRAAACWYATDLAKGCRDPPGGIASDGDDSLARVRAGALGAREVLMIYGRQDPHVPLAGRRAVEDALEAGGAMYEWHVFNGVHAFLRDENSFGRYDGELATTTYRLAVDFLRAKLGGAVLPPLPDSSSAEPAATPA